MSLFIFSFAFLASLLLSVIKRPVLIAVFSVASADVTVRRNDTQQRSCSQPLYVSFILPLCLYRSLGVVIWELFEFGSQPHRHLSDEEVLTFVIRERKITLAQPRLKLSHADYWCVSSVDQFFFLHLLRCICHPCFDSLLTLSYFHFLIQV